MKIIHDIGLEFAGVNHSVWLKLYHAVRYCEKRQEQCQQSILAPPVSWFRKLFET